MQEKRLTLLYLIFFIFASIAIIIIFIDKPIQTLIRAKDRKASPKTSVIIADRISVNINQKNIVRLTVFARNSAGEALADKSVSIRTTHGDINPKTANTDKYGAAVFTLKSNKRGKAIITASIDGVDLSNTITVYFKNSQL